MFSIKNSKNQIIKINDNIKKNFNLTLSSLSEQKIKNTKNNVENNKSFLSYINKIKPKKNNVSNNIKINLKQSNIKNKNKMNNNFENISKIKFSNNSSDLLNKSILTTSNSENKYLKKLHTNLNTYTKINNKNQYLKTDINNNKLFNIDKEFEQLFNERTVDNNNSNNNSKNINSIENDINFKQKEKLKKLKYFIFNFERKQKTIGNNNKEMINLEKGKKINFNREIDLNKYVPSINYHKDNLYFNKKYELILEKLDTKRNFYSKGISQNSQKLNYSEIKKYKSENKKINIKKSKLLNETSRTENNLNDLRIKFISKHNLNNTFITNNLEIPTNRNSLYKRNYSSKTNNKKNIKDPLIEYKERCESSNKSSSYKLKNSIYNISKILKDEYSKTLFPLTQRVITESNIIKDEIAKERQFEKLYDYFGEEDMKKRKIKNKKKTIDLNKVRKEINLYNINSYLNESNIILKGVKRIEKLLTSKREKNLARTVAQKVINEDILVNNYFDFDHTYSIRMQRLAERKLYSKFAGDTALSKNIMKISKKKKTEKEKLYKILRGGLENYFDKKCLKYLLFKYKAISLRYKNI